MAQDQNVEAILAEGHEALEADDLERAEQCLEQARDSAPEPHAGVLHLSGMIAWADQDLEAATRDLLEAVDLAPKVPQYRLDVAECLFSIDEIEEAELHARSIMELPGTTAEQVDESRLLLAQLRLADDDPEEALEILDAIDPSRKDHPAFLSTRGTVLVADERYEEAIADLSAALESDDGDPDLHYQLGVAYELSGNLDASRESMVRVLELESEERDEMFEDEDGKELTDYERESLRETLEDAMEELPDPVLKLVASVPITVQRCATVEQVRAGLNPRSVVGFLGTPKSDTIVADLKGIVIMRDLLLVAVEDEDEYEGELFYALVEEIQTFFQRHDLVIGEA